MLNTVKIPIEFEPIFEKAQAYVGEYFKRKSEDPAKGTIEISGERYILVRAASMSVDFFDTVMNLYRDSGKDEALTIARQLLFDIAHAIGKQDARNFHVKMGLKDPIAKLSAGPVHFAHSGWAFVDISPESKPSPDANYFLIYDHPYSFESDAWMKAGRRTDFPVCVMNAGYSSGWCEESFGISLVASEIMCKAKGDEACRFVMAPPEKIEGHIENYLKRTPDAARRVSGYKIPGFFERKHIEDALRESEQKFRTIFESSVDGIIIADVETKKLIACNKKAGEMLGYTPEEICRLVVSDVHPEKDLPYVLEQFDKQAKKEITVAAELPVKRKDGSIFYADVNSVPIVLEGKEFLMGNFRDVSERIRVEEEIRRSGFYIDSMGDALIVLDREKKIVKLNRAATELLGYYQEEAAGLDFLTLFPGREHEKHLGLMKQTVETGVPVQFETVFLTKSGREVPALFSGCAMKDQARNAAGFIGVAKDISESKKIDEALRKHMHELEVFYEASMGREKRIVSLKKEITDLQDTVKRLQEKPATE
ncbi:MAG: PAS domain S-box protein [Candidatus Omnitrophota bacterium]